MKVFIEHTLFGIYQFFINPNYRRFILYTFIYGSKKRFVSRSIKFNNYKIFVPDTLSFIWQYKDIFADENYKFQTNSLNPIIYDCGANIGVSCLYFNKNYPKSKIKAFEADPNIAKILKENLEKNNCADIEVINKAIWINNDGIELSLEGADGASIYSKVNVTKVPSVRLKDLIENENKIDMLKIDIEGAEYDVLLDCRNSLSNVENVFIEYHSFTETSQKLSEILQILEVNNFRYFINPVNGRPMPFINRKNKSNPNMDLQLNIYGYKTN